MKKKTNPSDFNIQRYKEHLEDLAVAIVCHKQARLSNIYYQLGHLSFRTLKLLARAGISPKELANMDVSICKGCVYGKAHRIPTISKVVKNTKQLRIVTATGRVVSVDKLVSPTPGFIPTHRGIPTPKRYIDATVSIEHFYEFTYIHPVKKLDGETSKLKPTSINSTHSDNCYTFQRKKSNNRVDTINGPTNCKSTYLCVTHCFMPPMYRSH